MKILLMLVAVVMFCSLPAMAQTSNSLPFTAVTPPAPPVLTSLSDLSASGKIYTGTKMPIIGTGFTSSCVVNIDGTAQAASTFTFVSATEIDYTIPASSGSTAGVSHTATVTCPVTTLSLANPTVTLPGGQVGVAYPAANLATLSGVKGGVAPYKFSLSSGSLPTGLTLSLSGVVTGTPSSAGSFTFSYLVKDSSGLSMRQGRVEVSEAFSAKNKQ